MQPYQTQNFALALMLATVGIPFYTQNGKINPVLNTYSAELLRKKYGTRYSGMEIEDAVRKACEDGNQGTVTFLFENAAQMGRAIDAYNKQMKAIEEADSNQPTTGTAELDIEIEDAARLCAQLIHNRKKLATAWRGATPTIAITGHSKTEKQGDRTVTIGSMKVMSLGASKETRAKLKL